MRTELKSAPKQKLSRLFIAHKAVTVVFQRGLHGPT